MDRGLRSMMWRALVLGAVIVGVSSCGDDETVKKPAAATTTTEAAEKTTTTHEGDHDVDTSAVPTDAAAWSANAGQFRGKIGTTHEQDCTPNPAKTTGSVWGAGTYTDDSSICTAAVQSGLITFAKGGTVTYEIAAGLDDYRSGEANGVASNRYGPFPGSFTFPDAPPGSVDYGEDSQSWGRTVAAEQGDAGTRITIECSAGGQAGNVWGSGPYTADSSICTAALHSGVIDLAEGGSVTVEVAPGADSYEGSTANGVTTGDYGKYDRSFVIVKD
ncbi:MAG: hypothetical protein IT195_12635 [Microthrixaceae bacterium]|nr:hypothetical protein [Microthrixaceae bacterium]